MDCDAAHAHTFLSSFVQMMQLEECKRHVVWSDGVLLRVHKTSKHHIKNGADGCTEYVKSVMYSIASALLQPDGIEHHVWMDTIMHLLRVHCIAAESMMTGLLYHLGMDGPFKEDFRSLMRRDPATPQSILFFGGSPQPTDWNESMLGKGSFDAIRATIGRRCTASRWLSRVATGYASSVAQS
jgi:hypothetical protein